MKPLICLVFALIAAVGAPGPAASADPGLDRILAGIEQRYAPVGFTARFAQTSTIKAMDITDTASGTITVKRPGKMRWTYDSPEPQLIVTDGRMLWIYRPDDNQVMVGAAPSFFGGGKGAGFLSDMNQMREDFDISLDRPQSEERYRLKMIPRRQGLGVSRIYVGVDKKTFDVERILTVNDYGDETRIELSDIVFSRKMDDKDFVFKLPEGAEILQLDP